MALSKLLTAALTYPAQNLSCLIGKDAVYINADS